MQGSSSHRRLWIALALSVALHAAVAVWLRSRPAPARASPANEPIEVAVTLDDAPPPARAETPAPTPEAGPQPAPRPRAMAKAPSVAPVPELAPPEITAADVPRRAEPDAPRAPRAPVSLLPRLEVVEELGGGTSDFAVGPEQVERGVRAPPQIAPEDLAGQIARETKGKVNVSRGLVHPYYSELGKTLLKKWDADRAVSRHGLKGFAEQFSENSKAWNNIWLEHAATFGASGNPLADQEAQPREAMAVAPSVDPNLAARQKLKRQMRKEFRATRKATLKVVQDREGRLLSVELLSPSNDAKVDKEAVADVRAAAMELPPPPPEALGARQHLVSHWQFELIISISPPVPSFSFEFDEALGFIDPRLPLDRRIYKRVRLISAE